MSSHHAIIYGLVYEKEYYIGEEYESTYLNIHTVLPQKPKNNYTVKVSPKVKYRLNEIGKEKIYEGSITDPYLEIGERIHVPELDSTIEITDRVRILGGGYCYDTNYVFQVKEDSKQKEEVYSAFYSNKASE